MVRNWLRLFVETSALVAFGWGLWSMWWPLCPTVIGGMVLFVCVRNRE